MAALALAIGQALATFIGPQSSPILAVGGAAIDATPEALKSFAIQTFGSNDKTALIVGIVILLAIGAAAIGLLATRNIAIGLVGIAIFGLVGEFAVVTRPNATAN